jgi:hypothetical protein
MSARFGYCLSAAGAKPDQYHSCCPGVFTDANGVLHVCGCPGHERED